MLGALRHRPSRRLRAAIVSVLIGVLSFGAVPSVATAGTPSPTATGAGSGSISGAVTDSAGAAVPDAVVSVSAADGAVTAEVTTGSQGGYTVPDLPAGAYYVSVATEGSDPIFWPGALTLAEAQTVVVSEDVAVTGIDLTTAPSPVRPTGSPTASSSKTAFALASPSPSPSSTSATYTLSGVVTGDGGAPIQAAMVFISGGSPWTYKSAQTGADGGYSVSGLPAGEYEVQASVFMGSYSDQTATLDLTADSELNFRLVKGGTISGKISGGDGSEVSIELLKADTLEMQDVASTKGSFKFQRVPAGRYVVLAIPYYSSEAAAAFYPGVTDPHDATVITVASEKAVSGLDWEVAPGRRISGTVQNMPGSSASVSVTAAPWDWNGKKIYPYWNDAYGSTGPDGRYTVTGVGDGDYTVRANAYVGDPVGGHGVVWEGYYANTPMSDSATRVAVHGNDQDGIDIRLFGEGTASGTIRAEGGSAPLQNTLITAYRWNGATWDTTLAISGWGRYSLGLQMSGASYGVPEGTYTIGFSDPDNEWVNDGVDYPYCPQYWNGKATLDHADRFEVAPGKNTPGIDATLRLKSDGCAADVITPGTPAIEGTPRVGGALTANPGTWAPEPIQLSYQWRANGVDIDGATSATFTPGAAQVGTKLTVAVTGSRPGYDSVTAVSPESAVVAAAVITPGTPNVSGTPKAGSELTADPGAWTPGDVSLAYQWLANGVTVPGATGSTFVPGDDEVGKTIAVTVTGTKAGYATASATSAAVGPVVAAPLLDLEVGTPRLDGDARVGAELTASPGTWGPQPVQLSYSWSVDGSTVAGAEGPRFTPGPDAVGKTVTVTVRGSKSGYRPATATAAAGPVAPGVITGGAASIAGDTKVGATLTAQSTGWMPTDVTLAYQWLSGGTPIEGATGQTFQPGADSLGATLQVEVTATLPGYTGATVRSEPVGPITPGTLQAGTPSLSGPALSGAPITVNPGTWGPEPVGLTYQWSVDDQPIEGATSAVYTPTTAQVGGHLTVSVTGIKPGYTTVTTIADAGTVSASIALDSSSALPGGAIVVTGTGYDPGETVRVELHSTVTQLGTAVADAEGNFRLPTTLPLTAVPGEHRVFGIGERSGREASASITIGSPASPGGGTPSTPAPAPQTLPATGTTVPIALTAFGILLTLGGVLLLCRPARRRV
ncbi:hypothetical protein AVW09_09010 [Microbacterium sp. T32]|nr:hypothetical protein AVW09_09010 [Microbacterium sp. T32]